MEFPPGTTAVLVKGKHVPLAEYLAGRGHEAVETAVSGPAPAPDVRAQTPEAATDAEPTAHDVARKAGVASPLADALELAGFATAAAIRDAAIGQLTAVSGVGKATAAKLKAAAEELLT